MANYIKRVKGYIAPVLVIYTVLVTYFLVQTPWDDVSKSLRRPNDVKFLDVLVQEEHRHMRSFQDVVQNYRGVVQIQIRDRVGEHKNGGYNLDPLNLNQTNISKPEPEIEPEVPVSKHQEVDFYAYDNDDEDIGKDLRMLLEKQQGRANREPRPVYQVEVEEWDEHAVHSKPVAKETSRIKPGANGGTNKRGSSNFVPGSNSLTKDSKQVQQKNGNGQVDAGYTTEYCEEVFYDPGFRPSICKRELAEFGSPRHIALSNYSLLFRELGDIYIYSAFLDTREMPYVVRIMAVGSQGRGNSKSVYWCVFYTPVQKSMVLNASVETPVGYVKNKHKTATQLTYYAASDGHQKGNQFYIMSCPVPEPAKKSLMPPHQGLFQILVGNAERPFLDTVQDSLTMKVIINIPKHPRPHSDVVVTSPPKKSVYFAKMEEDLSILNISAIKATLDKSNDHNISTITHENNNISKGNINNSGADGVSKEVEDDDEDRASISPVIQNGLSLSQRGGTIDAASLPDEGDITIVTCVAPLQGNVGVIQIVEFIELSLLLGSQHIVFYTFRVFEEVRKVLKMYEARGLVTVLSWNLPAPNSVWAKGRDVALNDCLYRTIQLYDYALFLDLDEFLVPRMTSDLPSFMKYLRAVHKFNATKISDIVFGSAYFPPPTKAQYKNLSTVSDYTRDINKFASLRSIHRTYFNPQHTLRMIKVSKAFRVGAGERKRTSFTISTRFAAVNHYSYCPQDTKPSNNSAGGQAGGHWDSPIVSVKSDKKAGVAVEDICNHTKVDWVMWRYKSKLIERTKESVKKLNRG